MSALRVCSGVLLLASMAAQAQAQVLYADNFNRTASAVVGSTSNGGFNWIENEDGDGFNTWVTGTELQLNTDGSAAATGDFTAWVDYDVDDVLEYKVEFDLRIQGTPGNAWHKFDPRRDAVDALFDQGWLFRSDGSNIDISFWNGSSEISVAQDVVAVNTDMKVVFDVFDNTAAMTILDNTGATTLLSADTQWLSNKSVDAVPDHVGFVASKTAGRAWVDDLVVTEITTDWAQEASDRWHAWRQARGGQMPIAAWSYFERYSGSTAEYATYGDAGLNVANVPRINLTPSGDNAQYLNAVAAGQDIMLGQFEALHNNRFRFDTTAHWDLLEAIYYASNQGVGNMIGYSLDDEPEPDEFDALFAATSTIYRLGQNNDLPIVNLLPNYGWTGTSRESTWGISYEQYVQDYIDKVHPSVLINTHYPTLEGGVDRPEYYSNMELFRTKALAHDIGLMGFVLVTDHDAGPYRRPSASDIRWQVNSHLAYGAQGIYYYNYRIGDAGFGEGLVDNATGTPTDLYPKVLEVNNTVQTIAPVLMQLKSTGVFHTGASVPTDTTQYTTAVDAPIHDFLDDDFLIGVFENQDVPSSDRYLYLVNKLHDATLDTDSSIFQTASFTLDASFNTVFVYDSAGVEQLLLPTGTFGGKDLFEYGLEGGEAVLIRMTFAAPTLPGDYNNDGVVDAADYTVWRDNLGTQNVLPNDPTGGTIGQQQYDDWRSNYGTSLASANSPASAAPEPCSLFVLSILTGLASAVRFRS